MREFTFRDGERVLEAALSAPKARKALRSGQTAECNAARSLVGVADRAMDKLRSSISSERKALAQSYADACLEAAAAVMAAAASI